MSKTGMTLGQLKERTAGVSDDTVIVLETHDHAFRHIMVAETTAQLTPDGRLFEDDPNNMASDDRRVKVLIIR